MTDELKLPDDDRPDEFVPDPQVLARDRRHQHERL